MNTQTIKVPTKFEITYDFTTGRSGSGNKVEFDIPDDIKFDNIFEAVEEFQKIPIDNNGEYVATLWVDLMPIANKQFTI